MDVRLPWADREIEVGTEFLEPVLRRLSLLPLSSCSRRKTYLPPISRPWCWENRQLYRGRALGGRPWLGIRCADCEDGCRAAVKGAEPGCDLRRPVDFTVAASVSLLGLTVQRNVSTRIVPDRCRIVRPQCYPACPELPTRIPLLAPSFFTDFDATRTSWLQPRFICSPSHIIDWYVNVTNAGLNRYAPRRRRCRQSSSSQKPT